ncbi:MAG: GNAT family N-acetyltransferase [Poseidonia sp.]
MVQTPELRVNDGIVLRPATNAVLVSMFEAYQEDAEAAQTALPWLDPNDDVRRQLRDMLYDIEAQSGTDLLHFWSIHDVHSETFVGLVGLGDELQSLHADFNLGYWVCRAYRRQSIASACVDTIFSWLNQRANTTTVEIAVHPHNEAGLATASAICERWNGERLAEFIGIEFNERTVPHHLHLVDLGPEA